ncbi:SDR family oxidoreductase [Patescibacteria group bacterium]|nr:SDR family oxidoreductase [Patescibacteria group bacterium]
MKVTVFGATGHVGNLFVEEALKAGHEIVAYVRNPKKMRIQNPKVSLVVGDLENAEKVEEAIKGSDAVVSVVGPLGRQDTLIFAPAYELIISSMKKNGVKRLIALGTPSVPDAHDRFNLIFWALTFGVGLIIHHGYTDMKTLGQDIRESGLEWTIVRVPLLTNRPKKGKVSVGYFGNGVTWFRLTRADFADFLVKQLTDKTYVGKAPAISN